ncbi:MAG: hypothetical protein ABFC31_11075 [Clostridiaceae bacterium]
MVQNEVNRCFKCGGASSHVHAFARLSEQESFLGVSTSSVCDDCLKKRIEKMKEGKEGWLVLLLPLLTTMAFGLPMLIAAEKTGFRVLGALIILFGWFVVGAAIYQQIKEIKAARAASDEENIKKYSPMICRENAAKAGAQSKLVEMKLEYALDEYPVQRISKEAGVTVQTATLMKAIILQAVVETIGKETAK